MSIHILCAVSVFRSAAYSKRHVTYRSQQAVLMYYFLVALGFRLPCESNSPAGTWVSFRGCAKPAKQVHLSEVILTIIKVSVVSVVSAQSIGIVNHFK